MHQSPAAVIVLENGGIWPVELSKTQLQEKKKSGKATVVVRNLDTVNDAFRLWVLAGSRMEKQ